MNWDAALHGDPLYAPDFVEPQVVQVHQGGSGRRVALPFAVLLALVIVVGAALLTFTPVTSSGMSCGSGWQAATASKASETARLSVLSKASGGRFFVRSGQVHNCRDAGRRHLIAIGAIALVLEAGVLTLWREQTRSRR